MSIGAGNSVVIDGKKLPNDQCYDGTPIANYKNSDGSCKNKKQEPKYKTRVANDNISTSRIKYLILKPPIIN